MLEPSIVTKIAEHFQIIGYIFYGPIAQCFWGFENRRGVSRCHSKIPGCLQIYFFFYNNITTADKLPTSMSKDSLVPIVSYLKTPNSELKFLISQNAHA